MGGRRTSAAGAPRRGARDQSGRPGHGQPVRRCAVYTRKSSEEGLEQEYNSLHAQREACEAYIRSQQHEGWRLVPDAYDDGGISGGTMERPGLQALLAGIKAGRIDIVVVYKVDRLTRSLADFAKMVEVFDANGASFVAVTQQFNTTTSMGRLTLNILLSFAQFEREVTGERIRDKIAASKRRGLWMGGRTPFGYEVRDRKLVVDTADAAGVVAIFRRYLALGCVRQLKAALDGEGVVSKPRVYAGGGQTGGTPYSRGALYAMLSNPVYRGQVSHKGERHPGQHAAIVPADLFEAVQTRLTASNGGGKGRARHNVKPSALAGKLFDQSGERLTPTHARKGERRYRYYVSSSLLQPAGQAAGPAVRTPLDGSILAESAITAGPSGWRLPAQAIEHSVSAALHSLLADEAALVADLLAAGVTAEQIPAALGYLDSLGRGRDARPPEHASPTAGIADLLQRVDLFPDGMMLTLAVSVPVQASGSVEDTIKHAEPVMLQRFVPLQVRRRGAEMRLVIGADERPIRSDPALLKMVARAHCWFEELALGRTASAYEIAHRAGVSSRYVQRLLPLALLAPRVLEAIVEGRHPTALTAEALSAERRLPIRWSEQRAWAESLSRDLGRE